MLYRHLRGNHQNNTRFVILVKFLIKQVYEVGKVNDDIKPKEDESIEQQGQGEPLCESLIDLQLSPEVSDIFIYLPYIKLTGCLLVFLYRRILLTAGLMWFSFIVKLLMGPERVYYYFCK